MKLNGMAAAFKESLQSTVAESMTADAPDFVIASP
jgi:hypothetical protein